MIILIQGPEDSLFMRFKERFHELDHADIVVWEWPQDPLSLMYMQAALVRDWAEQECVVGRFPRNDYRELCELLSYSRWSSMFNIFIWRNSLSDNMFSLFFQKHTDN